MTTPEQVSAPPLEPAPPVGRRRPVTALLGGGALAVVLVFDGGYAIGHNVSTTASSSNVVPGDGTLQPPADQFGPVAGEEHVSGTLTEVGVDSVTVESDEGPTATY